jgi:hypothetical protein
MATAKKLTLADKIRAYQAKNPGASAIQVAKACKTAPTYVYALRASDKKVKPQKKEAPLFGHKNLEAPTTMVEPQADRVEDHPLYAVFVDAIKQAMHGKGERHGGARTPFLEQPWAHYTKMHGRGFATGQATKKLEEAASTRTGEAFEQEVFGAIVYAGMAILKERGQV